MNKKELLENCTMEQLADMVIKYQNASEIKNDEIQQLKWTISNLEESNGRLRARVDTYVNYILPRATKEAKELLDKNAFSCIRIVAMDEDKKKCDCGKEDEINCLKDQLQRKETAINQIDDILNELFEITFNSLETKIQFEGFKECLKEKIERKKTIADFLPAEPIKVADMLINTSKKRTNCMTEREYDKYIFEKW